MPLSVTSYLLGVGTVVGAIACGFGGGVLLTNTVMKDTAAAPSRVERFARLERESAALPTPTANAPTASKENPPPAVTAPSAQPDQVTAAQAPAAQAQAPAPEVPAAQVPPVQVPPVQAELPKPDVRKQASLSDTDTAKQPQPARQAESTRPTDQSGTEQKKATDRRVDRIERSKRYAERRTRDTASARVRPQPLEVQDQPERSERPEIAYAPEEPHFDLFGIFTPPSLGPRRDHGE